MRNYTRIYIDGQWVEPIAGEVVEVINPSTEEICGHITAGGPQDIDLAVKAARMAFPQWAQTTRRDRLTLLEQIAAEYDARSHDLADALTEEMGAPHTLAMQAQVPLGSGHFRSAARALENFAFEKEHGSTLIAREAIGVCGLITPWNWPLHQIGCKVAPAIATGCTMVLKPSEVAPFSAAIFGEIMHAAGVPNGVFNLVQGSGTLVGRHLSEHPDVDLISFTGSTRAGIEVALGAAPSVKRVAQELGGKSACIVLDDPHLIQNVGQCVDRAMLNSGQSCNAPTRLLVPFPRMEEAISAARETAERYTVGDPRGTARLGPVVSLEQWKSIQQLIETGVDEGADLIIGGTGLPEGIQRGYYVRPTIFANVLNDMTIAREEIFGPVLCIIGYASLDEATAIANDSIYGLSAAVNGENLDKARSIARHLRVGEVIINGAWDIDAPFGGYRRSGNGRERGEFGFHDFLETKAIIGYGETA